MAVGPSLKARLRSGKRLIGALVRMPAEDNVEMLAAAGLDFAVVDCEHGPADLADLRHHIALAQLHDMGVLVRIGADDRALALRALDQGAQGVIAPHIDTVEHAQAVVRSVHYPPLGERGFATYPRAGGFGAVAPEVHVRAALESTLVVAMLESPTATRHATEILQTAGIDAFLIGTADLRAASTAADPPVSEAVTAIRADAAAVGAIRVDLVNDVDAARSALRDGAQMVAYNLTHVLMALFRDMRVDAGSSGSPRD